MYIKEEFIIGSIYQPVSRTKELLDLDNCKITEKRMNNKSIILHLKRTQGSGEANVFLRLKDEFKDNRDDFKKLLASHKVVGLSLNELKGMKVEDL